MLVYLTKCDSFFTFHPKFSIAMLGFFGGEIGIHTHRNSRPPKVEPPFPSYLPKKTFQPTWTVCFFFAGHFVIFCPTSVFSSKSWATITGWWWWWMLSCRILPTKMAWPHTAKSTPVIISLKSLPCDFEDSWGRKIHHPWRPLSLPQATWLAIACASARLGAPSAALAMAWLGRCGSG